MSLVETDGEAAALGFCCCHFEGVGGNGLSSWERKVRDKMLRSGMVWLWITCRYGLASS